MSFSAIFSFKAMMDSITDKYDKIVKPLFKRSKEADVEIAESHAVASRAIRSFIEEETAESLRKKTVLGMEATMSSALKKNLEIHADTYKSLQESHDELVSELIGEKETSKILGDKLVEQDKAFDNFKEVIKELNSENTKMAQEKEALKKEAGKFKEESIRASTKLLNAEEEIRAIKKSNQLAAEAKERDISELCKKMDRYQEQIAALSLICEKLQKAIPQDSSAIILTAMTKNEFDLKTAKPIIKAANTLDWMAGLDQTEICEHFCESIATTPETETKIAPIKKNIKLMAAESKTKILMEPEGTMAKLKKLKLYDASEAGTGPKAKATRKVVLEDMSGASTDD